MSSIWTVKPETVRLDLTYIDSGGTANPFSITVKKHLTVGETRRTMVAGWRGVKQTSSASDEKSPEISIDWRAQSFARTEAYLTDWTLTDDAGKRLPVTRDVIEALQLDVFELIENAITAHVEAIEAEKNAKAGTRAPEQMSA